MQIELPKEFIDFCFDTMGQYTFEDLKIKLFQQHRIEIAASTLNKKLTSLGFKINRQLVRERRYAGLKRLDNAEKNHKKLAEAKKAYYKKIGFQGYSNKRVNCYNRNYLNYIRRDIIGE